MLWSCFFTTFSKHFRRKRKYFLKRVWFEINILIAIKKQIPFLGLLLFSFIHDGLWKKASI